MSKRILYVTGTRADFGLMATTLHRLHSSPDIDLSLLVTGMHLSEIFGGTVAEIEASGLRIAARAPVTVEMGGRAEMARALADTLSAAVACLEAEKPDLVLVLGDRGEMLAGALAAIHLGIHVAHIQGGERSGTVDESIRHALSKIAHLHLVSTEKARSRLIAMGERADRITVTGAPGLDAITTEPVRRRADLAVTHGFDQERAIGVMLFHPVVQQAEQAGGEVAEVLAAVQGVNRDTGLQVLALMPNADAGSAAIREALANAEADTKADAGANSIVTLTHMPRRDYLDWLAAADVLFGNSSSGIIEAASFGIPVVNIGPRQNGREQNANTVDVEIDRAAIQAALQNALDRGRTAPQNVYGDGKAGLRIVDSLRAYACAPADLNKLNTY